jgi:hypothetical protein
MSHDWRIRTGPLPLVPENRLIEDSSFAHDPPATVQVMIRREVTTMKRKILIGAVISTVASLGLWLGLGSAASAHPAKAQPARVAVAHAGTATSPSSDPTEEPSGADGDAVQSGDQTSPDTGSADGTDAGSTGEGTSTETDGVDCQQDGNFDGVNAAGTGPGCNGSGT